MTTCNDSFSSLPAPPKRDWCDTGACTWASETNSCRGSDMPMSTAPAVGWWLHAGVSQMGPSQSQAPGSWQHGSRRASPLHPRAGSGDADAGLDVAKHGARNSLGRHHVLHGTTLPYSYVDRILSVGTHSGSLAQLLKDRHTTTFQRSHRLVETKPKASTVIPLWAHPSPSPLPNVIIAPRPRWLRALCRLRVRRTAPRYCRRLI